ncbi:PREDICTED: uncharacterized protein LOC104809223 [Tarenaya hassleriana]|uniref:uncharacterized protein LOC104809223 n=1 Tax=Tarenaya hassleriana TaxID=28532 RepID=UPI00053C78A0|nr:PREDICTED: uncharacterized protein LOC104809223 [Tarenaya hassleriana]
MVSDSVTDSSLYSGPPNLGDFTKKKRANWYSKLKQWKVDARRRQWLFHLKKGHVGEDENGVFGTKSLTEKKMDGPFGYLHMGRNDEQTDDALTKWNIRSDAHSSAGSSPTSVLTSKDPDSKSSDCFCCSEKMGEGEEEEEIYDDAFDNFEGFMDALNYFDDEDKIPSPERMTADEKSPRMSQSSSFPDKSPLLDTKNSEKESPKISRRKSSPKKNPQGKTEKSEQEQASSTQQRISNTEPLPCPICCEVMDATDLSFLPCPCGFKVCLFCHKKIVDNDGRCPSCRKDYQTSNASGEVSFQQRGRGILRLSPSFRGLDRA